MLLAIVDGIQFKLLGMLFSWHNEYLLLVLYNIFRGISHFVLHYLYANTNITENDIDNLDKLEDAVEACRKKYISNKE